MRVDLMGWFRRRYGAGPLHLLSLVACFAVAGYATSRYVLYSRPERVVVWFVASFLLHDLLLWPLYALADRSAVRLSRAHPDRLPNVPWINHLRVPVVLSAFLLAVSFPLVLRLAEPTYHASTGHHDTPFLAHWLLVTGALFAASALVYAIRLGRAVRRGRASDPAGTARATGPGAGISAAPPSCPEPS